MSLNLQEKVAIRKGESITKCGLVFYPIKMSDYELFTACKDALILRMSTLPAKYITKDYLSALFMLELDSIWREGKNVGLFDRAMRLLHISLRIGYDAKEFIGKQLTLEKDGDGIKITKIALTQDGETKYITPLQFSSSIRPLIAEMNGLELPNEKDNVDLVRAAEQKQHLEQNGKLCLKQSVDDLIASVAYQSRVRERDIYDWTVREFELRRNAIQRDKRYMLYGQAEMSGMVTFKDGNPAPSWCFDAIDESLGTMTLSQLQENMKGVSEKS